MENNQNISNDFEAENLSAPTPENKIGYKQEKSDDPLPNKPVTPMKPDKHPDPTKPKPGVTDPDKIDPTRIDEPNKVDPTRIDEPSIPTE